MNAFRNYAVYQLVVLGIAAIAVLALYLWSGSVLVALAGFATLALLGLRKLVLRGNRAEAVPHDEREEAIYRQATIAGYVALWLALVAWGTAVPLMFGGTGSVPIAWVSPVVWVAAWLVVCVQSITILFLDHRGT